jgi:hypothetical protein
MLLLYEIQSSRASFVSINLEGSNKTTLVTEVRFMRRSAFVARETDRRVCAAVSSLADSRMNIPHEHALASMA